MTDKVLSECPECGGPATVVKKPYGTGPHMVAEIWTSTVEALRAKLETAQGKLEESEWLVKKLRERLETAEAENKRREEQMQHQMRAGTVALDKATTAVQRAERRLNKYLALIEAAKPAIAILESKHLYDDGRAVLMGLKAALDAIEKGEE